MAQAMRNGLGDLVRLSQRIRFVPAALVGAPVIILIAFLVFPLLETLNMGYPFFRLACTMAFILSGAGVVAWIAEQRVRRGAASWSCLFILAVECPSFLALRVTGDFYWAFQRGYFLE